MGTCGVCLWRVCSYYLASLILSIRTRPPLDTLDTRPLRPQSHTIITHLTRVHYVHSRVRHPKPIGEVQHPTPPDLSCERHTKTTQQIHSTCETPADQRAVQLRPFCGDSNGFRGGVGRIGVTHIGFGAVIRYESHSHNGLEVGSSAFLPVMAVRLVPTIPANPNMGYF